MKVGATSNVVEGVGTTHGSVGADVAAKEVLNGLPVPVLGHGVDAGVDDHGQPVENVAKDVERRVLQVLINLPGQRVNIRTRSMSHGLPL